MENCVLVTGGAGFIGSNFVLEWVANEGAAAINLDKLTYAGNLRNLETIAHNPRHVFVQGDIDDHAFVHQLLAKYQPRAVVNFAAESHVDRSIVGPEEFVRTNIHGTFSMLEEARMYWAALSEGDRGRFRFLHVSTDEVYGSLGPDDPPFTEQTPYAPNSPYSASKAASDHLVRAYYQTYGLPVLTTNCSNNYGRFQFPEKLIPMMISNALAGLPLPIYGDGRNIRDWLYVTDHCAAIRRVLAGGQPGETYNVGGRTEKTNLEVVSTICSLLDELRPSAKLDSYQSLITFVKDRPGHDRRYAIDASKICRELGWKPKETFETGMRKTVSWYLNNSKWVEEIKSGVYKEWVAANYQNREALCEA